MRKRADERYTTRPAPADPADMNQEKFYDSLYWMTHLARNAPGLLYECASCYLGSRVAPVAPDRKFLVGTHHKVLTVFLGRVFRAFAAVANLSVSQGRGKEIDYACTVLLDHHSEFDMSRVEPPFIGLHVVRDPRDLLVSAMFYHQTAHEPWLHVSRDDLDGLTYQQYIRSLPDTEARLLFEIDHSSGMNIGHMLEWGVGKPGFVQLRYEELVGQGAPENFDRLLRAWQLEPRHTRVLSQLFRYFSLGGAGARSNRHIRNAESGQWREQFTPRVRDAFDARFPQAASRLGYPD